MFKVYKNNKEILQSGDYELLKKIVLALSAKNINMYYSIRDEDLPTSYPSNFTIKHFDENSIEAVWHKVEKGIYITEFDGKTIKLGVSK